MTGFLLDTNVVVRLMEPSAPEHPVVSGAIRTLLGQGQALFLAPQVLTELWVVASVALGALAGAQGKYSRQTVILASAALMVG